MKTTIPWMYDGHREAMKEAILQTPAVDSTGNLNWKYASALYLLTGLEDEWQQLQPYVTQNGIAYAEMQRHGLLSYTEWLIVGLSEYLFCGSSCVCLSLRDFIDLDNTMWDLALNGIALWRGTVTLTEREIMDG